MGRIETWQSAQWLYSYSLRELEDMTDRRYLRHEWRTANLASPRLRTVLGSTVILATPSSQFHKNSKYWHQYILFMDFVRYRNVHHLSMDEAVDKAIRDSNVHVFCDCPAWLYWADKYYATRDGYSYGAFRERRAPKKNNVEGRNRLCKHMSKALIWLEANHDKLVEAFVSYYGSLKARRDGTLLARDGEGHEEIVAVDVGGEPIRTTYVPDVEDDEPAGDGGAVVEDEPADGEGDDGGDEIGSSLLLHGNSLSGEGYDWEFWGDDGSWRG